MTSSHSSLSFTAQVQHQLRTEWQHHRLWSLALLVFMVLRLLYRVEPFWPVYPGTMGEPIWLQLMNILAPVALVIRVILAEPVASPDLGTLTRPLSRWALVLGKGLFLALVILLPWMMADAWLWRDLDQSISTCFVLLAGSALNVLQLCLLAAALACLATSGPQLTLFFLGLAVFYFGMDLGVNELLESSGWNAVPVEKRTLGYVSGFLGSLSIVVPVLLFITVWLLQTVGRRRRLAGTVLGIALVLTVGASRVWSDLGWLKAPLPLYTDSKLKLIVGPLSDAAETGPVQTLWSSAHLSGLPPRHVASVVRFAPPGLDIERARLDWVKDRSPYYGNDASPMREFDRARVLLGQYPRTDLTHTRFNRREDRDSLLKIFGPTLPTQPWQMNLAVYEMRQVLDLPLTEFIENPPALMLEGGQRVEFQPLKEDLTGYSLHWSVRIQASRLVPRPPLHLGELSRFGDGGTGAWAVLRDGSATENHIQTAEQSGPAILRSGEHNDDVTYTLKFHVSKPMDRISLAGLSLDAWLKTVRLEFWIPEFRGLQDLNVEVETMKQMAERQVEYSAFQPNKN